MSVANRVTYFLEDFILEDGKVGYGGAYLAGKGVVGYAVFVQIPGNLIEVAADPAVLGCQLPDSGKQLVIDRRHMGRMVARVMACRINSDWLIP